MNDMRTFDITIEFPDCADTPETQKLALLYAMNGAVKSMEGAYPGSVGLRVKFRSSDGKRQEHEKTSVI